MINEDEITKYFCHGEYFFVQVDNERGLDMWEPSIKEQSNLFSYIHWYGVKGEYTVVLYWQFHYQNYE